jgi:hypothetical protein
MTKGHQKPATEEEVVETPTTDKEPSVPELESEAEKPGPVEEVVEEPEKPKAEKLKITERLFRSRISFCQKKTLAPLASSFAAEEPKPPRLKRNLKNLQRWKTKSVGFG